MDAYEIDVIDNSLDNICSKITNEDVLVVALMQNCVLTPTDAHSVTKKPTPYLVNYALLELIKRKKNMMEVFVQALEDTGNDAVASDLKSLLIAKQRELCIRPYSKEFYETNNGRWRPQIDQFIVGDGNTSAGQDVNQRGSGSRLTANDESNWSGSRSVRQVVKGDSNITAGRNINK